MSAMIRPGSIARQAARLSARRPSSTAAPASFIGVPRTVTPGWVPRAGSWKGSICFRTRIGTMNWFVLVLVVLLVLENVQSGWVFEDEDEDEEEDEWPGSCVSSICFRTRIGTMNWLVLILVVFLVLENFQSRTVFEAEGENEVDVERPVAR